MRSVLVKVQARIKRWEHGLGLRLSGPISSIPHFKPDMLVAVNVSKKGITVRPVKRQNVELPFEESDLLAGLTPKKAHADKLVTLKPKEIEH